MYRQGAGLRGRSRCDACMWHSRGAAVKPREVHRRNVGSKLKWRMYAGLWQRYSPEGDLLVSYHGARLFDTPKDGVIKQINIYSTQVRGPASTASESVVRVMTALNARQSQ
jgi:hypothetical protein